MLYSQNVDRIVTIDYREYTNSPYVALFRDLSHKPCYVDLITSTPARRVIRT